MTEPTGSEARGDPVLTWQRLYLDAATAAPSVAACVAAAFRLADQVWRQVAADPALDARTRDAVTGEHNWTRTALHAFEHLAGTGAYAHLDLPAPLRCGADPARLRTWLHTPTDLPGYDGLSVAASWGIDEDFSWDADGVGARMATLVEQAQHAGLFGLPDHTITLRQVTSDDPDADPIVEHQVTLHTPTGAVLASAPIPADHLADDDLSGVDAAVTVLTNTARVVDELLAAQQRLIATATTSNLAHPYPRADRPRRGFTALDLTRPAIGPAPTPAVPVQPGRHHHR